MHVTPCLYYGLPAYQIAEIQRVQKAAARVVCRVPRYTHVTPPLKELLWLSIKYRIEFKLLILTFKAIYGDSPIFISADLTKVKKQTICIQSEIQ